MLQHDSSCMGESPFYLMLGQEPQLPIEYLSGRDQDPVPGEVRDWVVERQARVIGGCCQMERVA